MFFGLLGGNGRDDFDFLLAGAAATAFPSAFFGFLAGATDVLTADFAFFEAFLGMIAENDH
jgi:hypothetical protein